MSEPQSLAPPVLRLEDHKLLTGQGTFVANLALPEGALHAHFVASTQAHALITEIDVTAARAMPGVVDIITGTDVDLGQLPGKPPDCPDATGRPLLATERVRFVGEPIVAIVAETAAEAADAAEQVFIDYDPLTAVVRLEDSVSDDVLIFPDVGTNVMGRYSGGRPAAPDFADCEVVIDAEIVNQRVAPCPLETRVGACYWTDQGRLIYHAACQGSHLIQGILATVYDLDPSQIRVISQDVGGSFGAKARLYVEDALLPLLSERTGRPVRWEPTRSSDMVGLGHSRAQRQTIRLGGDRDGTIRAVSAHVLADCGAYPLSATILAQLTGLLLPGPFAVDNVHWNVTAVVTNTTPIVAYRGAGRPESAALLNRAVDSFAAEIGMDPFLVIQKNLLESTDLPWANPSGLVHDSGDYHDGLRKLGEALGYDELRERQRQGRLSGSNRALGIGLCAFVDKTSGVPGTEYGSVQLQPGGRLRILTGSTPYGQGHDTAWAILATQRTGVSIDKIDVIHGDTDVVPRSGITGGSRSAQMAGSAVAEATDALVAEARIIAADMLEAAEADIMLDLELGQFHVTGSPAATTVDWAEIAAGRSTADEEPLRCESDFMNPGATVPYGMYGAVVEVDLETGEVDLQRMVTVDDAGTILSEMLALGQVHGAVAQGIAQALHEEFVYDDDGVPLSTTMLDYGIPSATDLPSFESHLTEHPALGNPLGYKGIGESGTIGAVPAVQNAVIDAVSHLGVRHIDLPLAPQRVWRAINATRESTQG